MRIPVLLAALTFAVLQSTGFSDEPAKPKSSESLPETAADTVRVLLIGGGSSHDFEKWFHQADAALLQSKGCATAYTENVEQAMAELPHADVAVVSTNQGAFGTVEFQTALKKFADAGKGIVLLHPGLWYNWPPSIGYNATFADGGARSHDSFGPFTVTVNHPESPVMKGVPATFEVTDELYQCTIERPDDAEVLATTSTSKTTGKEHPSVWTVKHPSARIVCIALGHDGKVHDLPAFQSILANAVHWAAKK